ncbi:S-methyl-5-thioribose-1-phosphate isomerase [Ascosphaera atra]|nr:S-methyl-5-thioribose-1-phosphate isomerase [Ascosphaera atra]
MADKTLQAIIYNNGSLQVLDQLRIPHRTEYIPIKTVEDGWRVIKDMNVRGAPAIAIVAALSLAAELTALMESQKLPDGAEEVASLALDKLKYLKTSRPTAVNLSEAASRLSELVATKAKAAGTTGKDVALAYNEAAEQMVVDDIETNKRIGKHGAQWLIKNTRAGKDEGKVTTLTHCNTGSLATAGYGTALGVIRALHSSNQIKHAYCTETRPYLQGARLTAFELVHEKIPATLITDGMVGALLADKSKGVDAIVVGADRIAANGDTANKIGTYSLAVLAKYHGVKFLVAAPRTSIDLNTATGDEIIIEQRPKSEVTNVTGPCRNDNKDGELAFATISMAANDVDVWNPSFDVTPASLIDGIVTECGVFENGEGSGFDLRAAFTCC